MEFLDDQVCGACIQASSKQFGSGSVSGACVIYMHTLTSGTLLKMRNFLVFPRVLFSQTTMAGVP
jgi:hypothetical protein